MSKIRKMSKVENKRSGYRCERNEDMGKMNKWSEIKT